jgi:hypothetical protein
MRLRATTSSSEGEGDDGIWERTVIWLQRKTIPLAQMPDSSFATIRHLSDDDLHKLMEGEKPHSASHIAARREVEWRQDRAHVFLQCASVAISIAALLIAVVALFRH